jgi:23S rRNA pseudouridine955/2504/2580 synthase
MSGVQQLAVREAEAGLRLDKWFKRRYPDLTHGRLQKLARSGQIRLDGKRVKPGDRVEEGQVVRVPPLGDAQTFRAKAPATPKRPEVSDADADMIQAAVIYQDSAAIAINKPPGLATQGGTGTTRHVDGMLDALAEDDERPRLVHRLDRDTSGVLLLARSRKSAAKLTASFRDRSARKLYWALVAGVPDPVRGKIDLSLKKAGGRGNERMVWDDPVGADRAITFYATLDKAGRAASLVGLLPQTGRTHQLRAHMTAIGHPILGDGKYGGEDAQLPGMGLPKGMMLHARALDLPHPTERGRLRIQADLPPAFLTALATFGFDPGEAGDGLLDEDFR